MAVGISINLDREQRREYERMLRDVPNGVKRARSSATRRAVRTIRTRVVKAVRADLNVKQKDLFQRNNRRRPITEQLFRGDGGIVGGALKVRGESSQGGIGTAGRGRRPLAKFGAKQHWKKKGQGRVRTRVSYKIRRGAGRAKIQGGERGPFVATMRSGKVGVWIGKRGGRRGQLIELRGPSVPHVALNQSDVNKLLQRDAEQLFVRNMDEQVARLVERAARG